ncbi:MAG: hypothetical protein KHX03_02890 [Clostridium sp.]|nr:hypothetical protein [Clostridium sp.]
MTITVDNKPKQNVFSAFHRTENTKKMYQTWIDRRYHRIEKTDNKTASVIAASSILSTLVPMAFFAKKQFGKVNLKNLIKIKYELPEMLCVSAGSITGGVVSGLVADKKADKKRKINEGVFQFMNATVPTLLVGGALKLLEDNSKYKNSKPVKVAAVATGLIAGMPLAAFLSNLINDPKDKEPDRKLTLKDSIINMDDAIGALVLADFPLIKHLHIEKIMPAIFAWCGYRAGQSN